jgi:mono/diheme cytochrome c family protein
MMQAHWVYAARLTGYAVMMTLLFAFTTVAQQPQSPPEDRMPGRMWGNPGNMRGPMMGGPCCDYQQGWGDMSRGDRRWQMSMVRHHYVMQYGIPQQYYDKFNPLSATPENLQAGAKLYQLHCASCHGAEGYGDGVAGKALQPPPSNLAMLMRMGMMARDEYLYWTIAEGGTALNTSMPAFKETLSENDAWQLILHLRSLRAN